MSITLKVLFWSVMLFKMVESLRFMPRRSLSVLSRKGEESMRLTHGRSHGVRLLGGFGASAEKDPGAVSGTDLRVLRYPHPQLRELNEDITDFGDSLEKMANEMLLVMYAADGIGLAAPQVGINKRLMVFNEKGEPEEKEFEKVLVNPSIVASSEETDMKDEGCLSFPQIYGQVQRSTWVDVKYQDMSGAVVKERFQGFPARIFQHEYDHLDKTLFIDRMIEEDQVKMKRRLDKLIKKYGPGGAI